MKKTILKTQSTGKKLHPWMYWSVLILFFWNTGCKKPHEEINEILVVSQIADFHKGPVNMRLKAGNELFYMHYKAEYTQGKMTSCYMEDNGSFRKISTEDFAADSALQKATGLPVQHNWYVSEDGFYHHDTVVSHVEYLSDGYYLCTHPHLVLHTDRKDE